MPYPVSDIASNFALYNEVYPRGTVLHDKTNNAIRVADGITAYNDLPIVKGRVELVPVNANLVYCGPPSGAVPVVPTFRALVAADLGSGAGTATNILQDNGDGTTSWVAPSGGVTPSALTKTDDTNVTLTLGGTPATALLQATSITVSWSGQLAIARGGTGLGALGTANQLLRVNAGATALEYFTPTYITGLTVGTTPIASGTVGRIIFEGTGNVVQEAANLFYDNTNSRLSLGMGSSPGARLDVLGVGTGSTDISLRLRNSANSANLFLAVGSTQFIFGGATTTPSGMVLLRHNFGAAADNFIVQNGEYGNVLFRVRDEKTASAASIGSVYFGARIYNQNSPTTQQFDLGGFGLGTTYGDNTSNTVLVNSAGNTGDGVGSVVISTSSNFYINTLNTKKYKFEANKGNFGIAQMTFGTSGTNVLAIATGVAPTTSPADCFQQYSADIVAGNAAPHFRTENGGIIKLYQETTAVGAATLVGGGGTALTDTDTFDGYTLKQVVKSLRNQGLLA